MHRIVSVYAALLVGSCVDASDLPASCDAAHACVAGQSCVGGTCIATDNEGEGEGEGEGEPEACAPLVGAQRLEISGEGSCYAAFAGTALAWGDAERACRTSGGHLASIGTADDDALARSLAPDGWIGLHDQVQGRLAWTDGAETSFTAFAPNEPDGYFRGNNNCGSQTGAGWRMDSCTLPRASWVCEARTPVPCGDGFIGPSETCDDENAADGDGCSASCDVESGFECYSAPSLCRSDWLHVPGEGSLENALWDGAARSVIMEAGLFSVPGPLPLVGGDIIVVGAGAGTLIEAEALSLEEGSVRMRDVVIRAGGGTPGAPFISVAAGTLRLERVQVEGSGTACISVSDPGRLEVDGATFDGCDYGALSLESSFDIVNLVVVRSGFAAPTPLSAIVVNGDADGSRIAHATVTQNAAVGFDCSGSSVAITQTIAVDNGEPNQGGCEFVESIVEGGTPMEPLFVDPAAGGTAGLALLPGTPAVDASVLSSVRRDASGTERDAFPDFGAFEL